MFNASGYNTSVYAMPKRIIFFEVLMKMVSSGEYPWWPVHATRCKLLFIALLVCILTRFPA